MCRQEINGGSSEHRKVGQGSTRLDVVILVPYWRCPLLSATYTPGPTVRDQSVSSRVRWSAASSCRSQVPGIGSPGGSYCARPLSIGARYCSYRVLAIRPWPLTSSVGHTLCGIDHQCVAGAPITGISSGRAPLSRNCATFQPRGSTASTVPVILCTSSLSTASWRWNLSESSVDKRNYCAALGSGRGTTPAGRNPLGQAVLESSSASWKSASDRFACTNSVPRTFAPTKVAFMRLDL